MTGVLAAQGIRAGVTRVGQSLGSTQKTMRGERPGQNVKQTLFLTKQVILGTKFI